MIDQEKAKEILQQKLAANLTIVDAFESPEAWCFGLGLLSDDGSIMPLMGDSIIRVSKKDGEIK